MAHAAPDSIEDSSMSKPGKNTRVAWLFPSLARGYYWQPVFKEFVARCPRTAFLPPSGRVLLPGYEDAFEVHTLPGLRYIDLKKQLPDSRRGFIWIPTLYR